VYKVHVTLAKDFIYEVEESVVRRGLASIFAVDRMLNNREDYDYAFEQEYKRIDDAIIKDWIAKNDVSSLLRPLIYLEQIPLVFEIVC
jgi:hypothetical protein